MKKKILALLLALCLLLSGCVAVLPGLDLDEVEQLLGMDTTPGDTDPDDGTFTPYVKPPLEPGEIAFGDMVYERPDVDAFMAQVDEICAQAQAGTGAVKLARLIGDMYDAYDTFYTMQTLADIRYSMDFTDSFYREEYEYLSDLEYTLDQKLDDMYYTLAACEQKDTLERLVFYTGFFDSYSGDRDQSVWAGPFAGLMNQENQLEARYYAAIADVQEQYAGLNIDEDEADPDSPADSMGYTKEYYDALMAEAAPVMVELVKVRKAQSMAAGYPDYESFAWDWYYGRDYSAGDVSAYADQIRDILVPLSQKVYWAPGIYDGLDNPVPQAVVVDYVANAVRAMGDPVEEAFDCMMRRDLVDMSNRENKYHGSFETWIENYKVPFVLMKPEGTVEDAGTLLHEFGHFCNDYVTGGSYLNQDVSEILSQAMEYLALCYGSSAYMDEEAMARSRMISSLETYVGQMSYYEFESRLYKLPEEDLTPEGICTLYNEVMDRYGYETTLWSSVDWTTVPHFYTQPFYIISYVVSNDAAMQLYSLELESPGEGLALYNEMCSRDEDYGFLDFITEFGLENPLNPHRIPTVAKIFEESLLR